MNAQAAYGREDYGVFDCSVPYVYEPATATPYVNTYPPIPATTGIGGNVTYTYPAWPTDYASQKDLDAVAQRIDLVTERLEDIQATIDELRHWLIAHDGTPVTNPTRAEDI